MSVRFTCFIGCYSLFDQAGVVAGMEREKKADA
jgi:hypothetical protein